MPELNAHTEPVTRTRIEYRVFYESLRGGDFRIWNRTTSPENVPDIQAEGRYHIRARRWGVQRAEITELIHPIEWETR